MVSRSSVLLARNVRRLRRQQLPHSFQGQAASPSSLNAGGSDVHVAAEPSKAYFEVYSGVVGTQSASSHARLQLLRDLHTCGQSRWRPARSRGFAQSPRSSHFGEEASIEENEKASSSRSRPHEEKISQGDMPLLFKADDVADNCTNGEDASGDKSLKRAAKGRRASKAESYDNYAARLEHYANDTIHPHMERISEMYRRVELSYIGFGVAAVVVVVGAGIVIVNWTTVRTHVSKESAEVVSETIRDKQLQHDAGKFSKELLNHLLSDEEVAKTVAKWTNSILQSLKGEIGDLFVHILALEPVVQAVNRLADRLVAYLCANQTIKERVGQLLVDAICLDSSRNAAAQWAHNLVMREDVTSGFRDLVVSALRTEQVVNESRNLACGIVEALLSNPGVQNEVKRALAETLSDSDLRATAKDSLWSIVMPRWMPFGAAKEEENQKALRSVQDVMMMSSLTEEEKQVIRSLHERVRSASTVPSIPPSPEATETESDPAASADASNEDAAGVPTPSVSKAA